MTTASCGLEECVSPCHAATTQGRYCAPRRCYCGGCPTFTPVAHGQPVTLEELEARRQAEVLAAAAARAAAVPLTQAPAEVLAIRDQLRHDVAEQMGPARWQALQDRRNRD